MTTNPRYDRKVQTVTDSDPLQQRFYSVQQIADKLNIHFRTVYNLTPEEYRVKWGLPSDYPMVAPNYSKQRSAFAKKIGLGRSSGRRAATM